MRKEYRTESERDYSYPLHEKNRFQFLEKGGGWGPNFLSDPLPTCQASAASNSWMAVVQYAHSIPP